MRILGLPNSVEKPIIKANGFSIAAINVEQQVGEISQCNFIVPPEFSNQFSTYGGIVTITVESKSASGVIFKGKIAGQGFSNMTGSISCRVDLVHEIGSKLDSSSTLFPGNMVGGPADNNAYIKRSREGSSNTTHGGATLVPLSLSSGDFGNDVKSFLQRYMKWTKTSSSELNQPGEIERIQEAITRLRSFTGRISHSDLVSSGLSESINSILQSGTTSTTFWNVLSQFFAQVDLVMVCKADGELMLIPNYAGVRDNGSHVIPANWVVSFDQSSRYERTPKEVNILVSDMSGARDPNSNTTKAIIPPIGHATLTNVPASASGVLNVEPPPFMRSNTQLLSNKSFKPMMDTYAKMIGTRSVGQLMMCNVVCPLILDVFPGVPASFEHLSKIKSFSGDKIVNFNKKFDGYVYKITHEISTDGYPKTRFSMSNVTDGSYDKEAKNPLWTGAAMPSW